MTYAAPILMTYVFLLLQLPALVGQTSMAVNIYGNPMYNAEFPESSNIDYPDFRALTKEVYSYRQERLIPLDTFIDYGCDDDTVILDTRSVSAYNGRHIEGAINLPFSDFTEEKLAKVVGDKETRIIIYCNNNFKGDPIYMAGKMPPLALNIPTFINLYGYGYKNVYELRDLIDVKDSRVINKWKSLAEWQSFIESSTDKSK